MVILYGYYKNKNGEYDIHIEHAEVVRKIYVLFLEGYSIGGIVKYLKTSGIVSPTGKAKWTPQAIANMLSNCKYIAIVTEAMYFRVQHEKEKRSSKTADHRRTATRYNSQDVLSGLLVCSECGKNYRRITRRNGEIVWRCADRVENGSTSQCQNLHTVSEVEIKNMLQNTFGLEEFDYNFIKENTERVEIAYKDICVLSK